MSRVHSLVVVGSVLTLAFTAGACVKTTASDSGAGGGSSSGGGVATGGTIARSGSTGSGGGVGTIGSSGAGGGGGTIVNGTGGAGTGAPHGGDDAGGAASLDAGDVAATCSTCDRAEACCVAFVQKLYGGADAATECSQAYSAAMCDGLPTVKPDGGFLDGGYTMSAYISDCLSFLASGAQLGIAACQ